MNSIRISAAFLAAFALFGSLSAAPAENFALHKVYSDHMVLQRDREIRISGTAEPGGEVSIEFAGEKRTATAGADGIWRALFPAMKAGGPHSMTVSGKNAALKLEDILIGEVWVCSGQSNMAFTTRSARNAEAELAGAANQPKLRLLSVNRRISAGKIAPDVETMGWELCTPRSAAGFSAIGYFFGRDLARDLDIPVGMINSTWGGTPIESWISAAGYADAGLDDLADRAAGLPKTGYAEVLKTRGKALVEWEKKFFGDHADAVRAAAGWAKDPLPEPEKWKTVTVPANLSSYGIDRNGVFWLRKTVNIPEELAGKDLDLSLSTIDDCDEVFFNGEKVGATGIDTPQYWSVLRHYPVPGRLVRAGANTVAVRVIDHAFDGGIGGNARNLYLGTGTTRIPLAGDDWKMRPEFLLEKDFPVRPGAPTDPALYHPASLYNAMIAGLQRFPVRGVLWYQGEGNTGNAKLYARTFPALIESWRKEWNDPGQIFIFAQLSSLEANAPRHQPLPADFYEKLQPRESNWAALRESQSSVLRLPNTGMAVTTDVGDPVDIHPTDKQTVARRMRMEALRLAYGRRDLVSSGPQYAGMKVEGNRIRVSFTGTGSGLVARGGALRRFAVAGKDGVFRWAKAEIDGDTVVVSSPEVPEPVAVRYAWDNNPIDANLFNREGFPASGFRSDRPDYLR